MANNEYGIQEFSDPYTFGQGFDPLFTDPNSVYGRDSFAGWIDRKADKGGFDFWKSMMDKMYERESTVSSRAWDLWFDSTATQRRAEDLRKAGLNPWLAISGNGSLHPNTSEHTASSGGNARSQKSGSGSIGVGILGLAKLIQVLSFS